LVCLSFIDQGGTPLDIQSPFSTELSQSCPLNFAFIISPAAQQEAERAKYIVLGAQQEKKTIITKARGEAESAELIGMAVKKNPGFMKLRRIDAARDIADIVAKSGNKVYLNADSLLLNLLGDADEKFEKSVNRKW
jgi:prohibitin 2